MLAGPHPGVAAPGRKVEMERPAPLNATAPRAAGFRWLLAAACVLALTANPAESGGRPDTERPRGAGPDESIQLPVTFNRVWFRNGKKRGWGGAALTGELTVGEAELHLSSPKRDVSVPLSSIHRVSFGKMRGDVDTDWIVMSILEDGQRRLIGFRDGRKMGYGQHTDEIYQAIMAAVRRAGAAQYDVPAGFEPYLELEGQLTLAIPRGWSAYHRALTATDRHGFWGEAIFSPEPVVSPTEQDPERREELRRQALRAIDSGEAGAFFVERREARRGMRCEGFSDKAVQLLQQWVAEDPLFEQGRSVDESVRTLPVVIDDCNGLRVVRHSRQPDDVERVLDLRAISDGEIVFLFGLRSQADRYDEDLKRFETAMGSVRFSVARGPR